MPHRRSRTGSASSRPSIQGSRKSGRARWHTDLPQKTDRRREAQAPDTLRRCARDPGHNRSAEPKEHSRPPCALQTRRHRLCACCGRNPAVPPSGRSAPTNGRQRPGRRAGPLGRARAIRWGFAPRLRPARHTTCESSCLLPFREEHRPQPLPYGRGRFGQEWLNPAAHASLVVQVFVAELALQVAFLALDSGASHH